VFDCKLGLGGLDLIALLADALGGNVVALLLVFFLLPTVNLKMTSNEGRCELVLGNC
jgi:hypothetical protein